MNGFCNDQEKAEVRISVQLASFEIIRAGVITDQFNRGGMLLQDVVTKELVDSLSDRVITLQDDLGDPDLNNATHKKIKIILDATRNTRRILLNMMCG